MRGWPASRERSPWKQHDHPGRVPLRTTVRIDAVRVGMLKQIRATWLIYQTLYTNSSLQK
jgi:hypothetical protein